MKPGLEDTLAAPPAPPAPADGDRTATLTGRAPPGEPNASLATGQQLGHFRIERRLGFGGMGEVYLATDLALDRMVAIKVLPDRLAHDPGRRDRMIREARAQARVAHPNVGHMYFVGEEAGHLYFAMEYVSGQTLAERIAQGPMPIDEALAAIRAAALGLREAQRSGFTHRDVKPSNLMIDGHGVVKVLDFGLAAGAPHAAIDGPVAQTSLAGTPLYMAPEQARGEAVDFRTDIYALGATLYHLVSGKPPFQAETVEELVSLHASAPRPAMRRTKQPRREIAAIDQLCARMMAARPDDRFASYDELLRAIELASSAHTRPAGLWVRGIAQLVDTVVIAIPTALLLVLAYRDDGTSVDITLGPAMMVALAIYHALVVARWGTTLGKSLLELEVVDVHTGTRPSLARASQRSLILIGIPGVFQIAEAIELGATIDSITSVLSPGIQLVIVGFAIYATLRTPGKRTLWDRVSGTMVRYRTGPMPR